MRITPVDPASSAVPVKTILDGVARKLGRAPPLMCVMAHSPVTLSAYIGFMSTLAGGVLGTAIKERIALAVAQANQCHGCLAAHTRYARAAGMSEDEITAARSFSSYDPKVATILSFARAMLDRRGHVTDDEFAAARRDGLSEAAMVEIAAHVAINVFTNSVNSLAAVPADPPAASVAHASGDAGT